MNGVDVNRFNVSKRVSKSVNTVGKSRVSVPKERSSKDLKKVLEHKIQTREIHIGEKVVADSVTKSS